MRIAQKWLPAGSVAKALIKNSPRTVLSLESRRRSRQIIMLDSGEEIGLALSKATVLHDGDLLLADDGQFIVVQAASEPVLRVTANTAQQLARAAYHLGNRHVLLEVGANYLQLENDPVLADMLRQLGGVMIEAVNQPFEPETGAYGGGHKHGHDETFPEDYALAQAAYVAHDVKPKDGGHSHVTHSHSHDTHGHHHPHKHSHD